MGLVRPSKRGSKAEVLPDRGQEESWGFVFVEVHERRFIAIFQQRGLGQVVVDAVTKLLYPAERA
jgi:hypothetical protein